MVDTGSTDGSVDFLNKINEKIQAKDPNWEGYPVIKIEHFDWVNDFAKARNYAFSKATTDYIYWMDLDDSLSDAKAFINWRDTTMHAAHYWVALYNYAFTDSGQVECKFIRERVIKRDYGFKWDFFIHEGLVQTEGRKFWPNRVSSWHINHRRTADDRKKDHMRNIGVFESAPYESLAPRMKFYYGKELVENGFPEKGGKPLQEAIASGKLDVHDLILAIQYAAQSATQCKSYPQAIELAMQGLRIVPGRAENYCLLGDIYEQIGQLGEAIQEYEFALTCKPNDMGGVVVCYDHAYGEYPHLKLANIGINTGNFDLAKVHIDWMKEVKHPRAQEFSQILERCINLNTIRSGLPKTSDVVITCPPVGAVTDWDENTLASKGHGGSETAAIEVASWIKKKTGRSVKIFHPRAKREVMPSGVEYIPSTELVGYLHNIEPEAHIAWRHSVPLTKAKTFIWCHDLQCPGAEKAQNYDKIVALSQFHKDYLIETNGVPENKITLGFNGINPDNFKGTWLKDPLKVVFSSSPDRGLVQTIDIVKKAREISGLDLKLHCFYGFENMRKAGQNEWADSIEKKIKDNDFVVAHGMVTKEVLMQHFKESGVWLYPNDFIETFCITAIESLCAGTWPIVRDMGALKNTLSEAIAKGMCDFTTVDPIDEASYGIWANLLVEAVLSRKWERVKVDPANYSWERVADFFIKELNLDTKLEFKEGA